MLKYFLSTLKIENRYRYLLHSAMTEKINLKREIANLETFSGTGADLGYDLKRHIRSDDQYKDVAMTNTRT